MIPYTYISTPEDTQVPYSTTFYHSHAVDMDTSGYHPTIQVLGLYGVFANYVTCSRLTDVFRAPHLDFDVGTNALASMHNLLTKGIGLKVLYYIWRAQSTD